MPKVLSKLVASFLYLPGSRRGINVGSSLVKSGLIIDTDLGFDDLIAMKSYDSLRIKPDISLITTVHGMNTPGFAAHCLREVFPSTNIVCGGPSKKRRSPGWLLDYRKDFNQFADEAIFQNRTRTRRMNADEKYTDSTEKALINMLEKYQDNSVDLICLGPLTNVANWLRSPATENLIAAKLKSIWIMGGNDVAENESVQRPEFNFNQDSFAAYEVMTNSNITNKICVVTEQVSSPQNAPEGLFEYMKTKYGSGNSILSKAVCRKPEQIFYDPVCVFSYSKPDITKLQKVPFQIDPHTGLLSGVKSDDDYQMKICTVNFLSHFPIKGKDGLSAWIGKAMLQDESQEQIN